MKYSSAITFCLLLAVAGMVQGEGHTANVVTLAESQDAASTLVAALKATGLDEALAAEGPFTVFAPTNDAFTALLAELGTDVTGLLAREDIVDILKYHVVSGKIMSSDLSDGQMAKTLSEGFITVGVNGETVMINDATVVSADLEAGNGVIHVIDKVLLPPTTIVTTAKANDFNTLVAALETTGLDEALSGPGPFTVFAPTDDAFTTLLAELGVDAAALLARDDLPDILKYHVVSGKVMSSDLSDGQMVETLQGGKITISITDGTVMINNATVTTADVDGGNGVIHIIDQVLLPPAVGSDDSASSAAFLSGLAGAVCLMFSLFM